MWLDYFAPAAIPSGITRPQFVPLVTVGAEGAGWQIGDVVDTTRVLAAFGAVLTVAFRAELARWRGDDRRSYPRDHYRLALRLTRIWRYGRAR